MVSFSKLSTAMAKKYNYKQKIVVFGGGTGQFNLLRGLVEQNQPEYITAIPGTWDSGGSSGRLRTELGILPPGDARRCLIALLNDDEQREIAISLFDDRLEKYGKPIRGHSLGNLIIASLDRSNGGHNKGLDAARKLFGVKSNILPVSLNTLTLVAKDTAGQEIVSEEKIDHRGESDNFNPENKISSIYFDSRPRTNPQVLSALKSADKIIFSMGSFYGSILPHLLIPGVREAILKSGAKLFFIVNIMTELGQTDTLKTVSEYMHVFLRYLGEESRLDYMVVNDNGLPAKVLDIYKKEGQEPVGFDKEECLNIAPKVKILLGNLASYSQNEHLLRHDPDKLAQLILEP